MESVPRMTALPACVLMRARFSLPLQGDKAPAACGAQLKAWCGSSISRPGDLSVNRPLCLPRLGAASIVDGTLACNLPQQALA